MTALSPRRRFRPKVRRFRPACQRLEDRLAPASFVVTTLADNIPGSLRDAITKANSTFAADDIVFAVAGQITLTGGELFITEPLSINGPGIVVNANNKSRVFNTSGAANGANVTFINLLIANGNAADRGGGIFVGNEALTLVNCTLTGNTATGISNNGGGIYVQSGSLTLVTSTIVNNHADDARGGGIALKSGVVASITNCLFAGNTAEDGGAIDAINASLTMTNSTLAGNSAIRGGGLRFSGPVGAGGFFVRNSTLSGNSASSTGGGIVLDNFSGTLTVQNSTITKNSAGGSGGGGIGRISGTGLIDLESTIVAGNADTVAGNEDLFTTGTVTAIRCAIGTKTGAATIGLDGVTSVLLGQNLQLGPFANNGGLGGTHVPAPTSPLLDMGSNPAALTTDQRSSLAARNSNGGVDIGAVELQVFLVTNTNNGGTGSLRTALSNANALGGSDTVAFDTATFNSATTITLTTGEIAINSAVTIIGPAAALSISGNANGRIFSTTGAATNADIAIKSLTMISGKSATTGGAVFVGDENLSLTNCIITGCTAVGGGAIYVQSALADLNLLGCIVSNNTSTGPSNGGAIFIVAASSVSIQDTTISGNTTTGNGGAIAFLSGGGLQLVNSTLSGNTALVASGGGLVFLGAVTSAGLNVVNSTISGNEAGSAGGGIVLGSFSGSLIVQNSTITDNTATTGSGGGGIARVSGTGSINLESTIVSGNTNAAAPDIFSTGTVNMKTSAVGSGTGFTKTELGGNLPFQAHSTLKLGVLANNGGPTLTHTPLLGSPLINSGSNPEILTTDQRGVGFGRVVDGVADIGAVERPSVVVVNVLDSGIGSLRQAIINANSLIGTDTITFEPSVFATLQKITLTTGDMAISEAVTIIGPPALVTIDANAASRIFNLTTAATGAAVLIRGLALTNGNESGFGGGAILVDNENLTIEDCSITNSSTTFTGGGIRAAQTSSKVTIRRSTLSGNSGFGGGAIHAFGTLTVENSTLSGNVGLVSNSGGAAIYFSGTTLAVKNCTMSGNVAGLGAAVLLNPFNGTANIQNTTITGNSAGTNGGGICWNGGGTFTLSNTIVAGNISSITPDIFSFFAQAKIGGNNNLIGVADPGNFTLTGTSNQTGTLATSLDAKLGTLANNGGPTQTHALLPGSPAINTGNNSFAFSTDQRGSGFARKSGSSADIGAFEVQQVGVVSVEVNGGDAQRSRVTTIAVTFDKSPVLPANPADAFQLRRQGDDAAVTLSANVAGSVVTLTFTGGAVDGSPGNFSLIDGRYTLTALAAQINLGGLDGNANGTPGDDFVLVGDPATNKLFRLFGDSDGNGIIDLTDFGAFRVAFGGASTIFSFDGIGPVDLADFGQFRIRFGIEI